MPQVKSVKFHCTFPGRTEPVATYFSTGVGPCGKTVKYLRVSYHESGRMVFIYQETECGEIKEFTYQMSDIFGRIETIY